MGGFAQSSMYTVVLWDPSRNCDINVPKNCVGKRLLRMGGVVYLFSVGKM
jgi:hypothetical protein